MSLAALRLDLGRDRVITAPQAHRYYRVTLTQARDAGIRTTRRILAATVGETTRRKVTFLVGDPAVLRSPASRLRHLALATTARLELGVDPARWENDAGRTAALLTPDALWHRDDAPSGAWAVEIDTGSYSRRQVRDKVRSFGREHGFTVWITPSDTRATTLRAWLADLGAVALVQTTRWP